MSSIDRHEIEHFSKDAPAWWDENGAFRPLHRLNPVRLAFIKREICEAFGRDFHDLKALEGLRILDVGCGGGLVCEPLARLGADVTGADADSVAIEVGRAHAGAAGLDIKYVNKAAEDIDDQFDVVFALEIIEHVHDPAEFVASVAKLCKPDGIVIFSTLNRTAKSYALGIVAAERVLRWVPRGTHSWQKFVKPSELSRMACGCGLEARAVEGLIFNPLIGAFQLSKHDLDVNYLMSFRVPQG